MPTGETHGIDVARPGLILWGSVATVGEAGKGVGDVVVRSRGLLHVEFVSVPVRVSTAGVTRFGAACDGDIAAACALERDGAVDGFLADLVERRAAGVVTIAAAA